MQAYTDKIRNIATRLLKEGKVDVVIGFRKGTVPMMNEPCFITNPDKVSSLIWDSNCRINLANYLIDRKEKLAVLAKGCDSRNIVTHITENKIDRDQLYIIGIPCTGMIDKGKVNELVNTEITKVHEKSQTLLVETSEANEITIDKNEVLQNNCIFCSHRNPVISDEIVADIVKEQRNEDEYTEISKIEKMECADRWNYFSDVFSSCIRCYACKNICPLCYCPVCFVDESNPQWVGKGQEPIDVRTFHFLRAYHCAGRCTSCGACVQACPVGIDMLILVKKLEKVCKEQFGWEAGLSLDSRPFLDTYRPEDPDDFIK